jgi:carbamoyltransferase
MYFVGMHVLGVAGDHDCHDTSAAIVCNGVLVAAAEEERFSRVKHEPRFPLAAIDYCLRAAGLRMDQVHAIAFPEKPFWTGCDSYLAELDRNMALCLWGERPVRSLPQRIHKRALDACLRRGARFNWGMDRKTAARLALLGRHYSGIPPVRFYDHHRAHAAAAYFTSGWDEAAVVTMDWSGGPYATVTWKAHGPRIDRLRAEPESNSLGKFYSDCTMFLGVSRWLLEEGKTMGLAAYGDKAAAPGCSALLDLSNSHWYRYRRKPSRAALGFPPGIRESVLDPPYRNLAAAAQQSLEEVVQRVVRSAVADSGARSLCLGGGVSLNCSSNGALRDTGLASPIWLFPGSGDAGLSVGAALLCAAESGERSCEELQTVYLGPGFSSRQYEMALEQEPRVQYVRAADVANEVAQHLAAGRLVGWFQGRMEFGPRALGNRSILADPRSVKLRDRVNRLKGREMWRPLAPVVPAERAGEFFESAAASPFMLFRTFVKPCQRERIAGVVHVDGSVRPQTLTRGQNPLLYDLLLAFERRAEVPVLLNTSFNAAGEPVVCTPADAIAVFCKMGLDLLVLGEFLVVRRDSNWLDGRV